MRILSYISIAAVSFALMACSTTIDSTKNMKKMESHRASNHILKSKRGY